MLVLSATAALSAALAMVFHDRTLAADLEKAAQERLDRAAIAARRLAEDHLSVVGERYRAISRTPALRANLEVDHAPTLAFYAETLAEREGAALVAFFDRQGALRARAGEASLLPAAGSIDGPDLLSHGDDAYAFVTAELHTSAGPVGRLVAAERIHEDTLHHWSELCGVDVRFARPGAGDGAALSKVARRLGSLDLQVASSLEAETAALRRSRMSLVAAGSIAVALSLVACTLLARGFVRPILAIRSAADRIRGGDLDVRLRIQRGDEIGDVARAFDLMLDDLSASRREIERNVAELRRSEQNLANAQELARLGSFELALEKRRPSVLRGSEQLRSMFQIDSDSAEIDPESLLAHVHPDDREAVETAVVEAMNADVAVRSDFRLLLADGDLRVVHVQAQVARDASGEPVRLEGAVQDVTDRRRAEDQIRYLAHHDGLTGLGNRRHFADRLGLAIAQAKRRGTRFGVLHIDLDQFKRINDIGPSIGDEVLRTAADRLVGCLRETDVVATGSSANRAVSRLGGDEFIVLLNDLDDPKDLAYVASRVLYALARPIPIAGHELVLGASIGIVAWPNDGEAVDALLMNAGSAMRHAKSRGGNRYAFYDESMSEATTEILELESRIRRALETGEFRLHYQPKVRIADGRVTGFEALMRWRDPTGVSIPPGTFIPVAEQCGLIVPLGQFALSEACHQIARWEEEMPGGSPVVAVNLSPHQFKAGNLVETVTEALETSGAPAERLELEITESAVLHDEKGVIADLERLRALGIRVSLDDFGTGQSSLSHVRRLPVDTLKIDMSFVRSIAQSDEDARLTAAIVSLGLARGLCVIAEGVETEEQRSLLAGWGCDEIQGFLISPAVPADQATAMLAPAS